MVFSAHSTQRRFQSHTAQIDKLHIYTYKYSAIRTVRHRGRRGLSQMCDNIMCTSISTKVALMHRNYRRKKDKDRSGQKHIERIIRIQLVLVVLLLLPLLLVLHNNTSAGLTKSRGYWGSAIELLAP